MFLISSHLAYIWSNHKREIKCEKLHHHVVITHAQPEVNFSSNRIGHVSCMKARGLRPRADKSEGESTIPSDILVTAQRPDFVCIYRPYSPICILELTICFETNLDAAHESKFNGYASLTSDLKTKGYKVNYFAVEIGSRGYVNTDNQSRLKLFFFFAKHLKV